MVIAMINDLPRWSRFRAESFGKEPLPEPVKGEGEKVNWYAERRMWDDDRELLAGISNGIQELLVHVPRWKKPPELTPIGPPEWRGLKVQTEKEQRPVSIEDAMRVFGWPG